MIEGKVNIAQHEFAVQDGQLMVFIPGGEGGSEPLTRETLNKIRFLERLAEAHFTQEVKNARHQRPVSAPRS